MNPETPQPSPEHPKELEEEVQTASTEETSSTEPASEALPLGDEFGLTPADYQREFKELDFEKFQELKQKSLKLGDTFEKLRRSQADFQNYQKRMLRERETWGEMAQVTLLNRILAIFDNFDRAVDSGKNVQDFQALFDGLVLTQQDVQKFIHESDLEEINPLGQTFDAHYHEAMMQQETEEYEPGKVVLVFQKGYTLKKRLVRPAKVVVSKKKDSSAAPS
jgi:molecular chaperone GrpE